MILIFTISTKPFFRNTFCIYTMSMKPFDLTLIKKHTNFSTQFARRPQAYCRPTTVNEIWQNIRRSKINVKMAKILIPKFFVDYYRQSTNQLLSSYLVGQQRTLTAVADVCQMGEAPCCRKLSASGEVGPRQELQADRCLLPSRSSHAFVGCHSWASGWGVLTFLSTHPSLFFSGLIAAQLWSLGSEWCRPTSLCGVRPSRIPA